MTIHQRGSQIPSGYWRRVFQRNAEDKDPANAQAALAIRTIRSRVHTLRNSSGVLDLSALGHQLGVSGVREAQIPVKGRLVRGSEGLVIEVDHRLSDQERTLTQAHELCHLLLEGEAVAASSPRTRNPNAKGYSDMERLCDVGARELLVDGDWLLNRLRGALPSLVVASDIASQVGQSLEFIVERIFECGAWSGRLIWWQISGRGRGLVPVKTLPPKDERYLQLIRPVSLRTPLGEALAIGGIRSGKLAVTLDDVQQTYEIECKALDTKRVLSLLVF